MKKHYTVPEAKLLGFAPTEATATSFDDLMNSGGGVIPGQGEEATASEKDITIEGIDL